MVLNGMAFLGKGIHAKQINNTAAVNIVSYIKSFTHLTTNGMDEFVTVIWAIRDTITFIYIWYTPAIITHELVACTSCKSMTSSRIITCKWYQANDINMCGTSAYIGISLKMITYYRDTKYHKIYLMQYTLAAIIVELHFCSEIILKDGRTFIDGYVEINNSDKGDVRTSKQLSST